jgi:hypothetical protein
MISGLRAKILTRTSRIRSRCVTHSTTMSSGEWYETRDNTCGCRCCGMQSRVGLYVETNVSEKYTVSIIWAACSSETLFTYKTTRRYNPEDKHRHLHRREPQIWLWQHMLQAPHHTLFTLQSNTKLVPSQAARLTRAWETNVLLV